MKRGSSGSPHVPVIIVSEKRVPQSTIETPQAWSSQRVETDVVEISRYALNDVVTPNLSTDCLILSSASYAVLELGSSLMRGARLSTACEL